MAQFHYAYVWHMCLAPVVQQLSAKQRFYQPTVWANKETAWADSVAWRTAGLLILLIYHFIFTDTNYWYAASAQAAGHARRWSAGGRPEPLCCIQVQLLNRRREVTHAVWSVRLCRCKFFEVCLACQGPNFHTDILCSVTTRPVAHRTIPEQWLAYVWALCSSTPTQKAGGPCSHKGQVVSSGISPCLSHSRGDRCKQLHLHAGLHYSSKERLSWTCAMHNKRTRGPFVCCFLLLLSYKKSRAQA